MRLDGVQSWAVQVAELQRLGIATPDNVEKLARERWGHVPPYVAAVARMWRAAIARDATRAAGGWIERTAERSTDA